MDGIREYSKNVLKINLSHNFKIFKFLVNEIKRKIN